MTEFLNRGSNRSVEKLPCSASAEKRLMEKLLLVLLSTDKADHSMYLARWGISHQLAGSGSEILIKLCLISLSELCVIHNKSGVLPLSIRLKLAGSF